MKFMVLVTPIEMEPYNLDIVNDNYMVMSTWISGVRGPTIYSGKIQRYSILGKSSLRTK